MKNTFKFLGIITIAAIIVFSFVSCGILDLSGKEEKKEQTEEPKENPSGNQPGEENPGGNQPGNQPGGNQPGGNNPGGEQPGENPGGETPGEGEESEKVKAHSETIRIDIMDVNVTGNMTDAQWQIGFPGLEDKFMEVFMNNIVLFIDVFNNNSRTIVLEWKPGYNYKADPINTQNAKLYLNVEAITSDNILAAVIAANSNTGGQAKVDARDTVRMAKAPVNGKAFAAQDTRRYWLGYFCTMLVIT